MKAIQHVRLKKDTAEEVQRLAELEERSASNMVDVLVKEAIRNRQLKRVFSRVVKGGK